VHDTVETGTATLEEVKKEFGPEIALIVSKVMDIGQIKYLGTKRHVEALRKLLIAMSTDVRILVVKFAERIHNLETLQYVYPNEQTRYAEESLEVFAPLAHRLGIRRARNKIETLAFPYAYKEEYKATKKLADPILKDSEEKLDRAKKAILKEVAKHKIKIVDINYRVKNLYNIYRKLERKNNDINSIYDIFAVRIVVESVEDCYVLLGIIQNEFKTMGGRLKDYIAIPKSNGYQSIHTTIISSGNVPVEVQIRTKDMHEFAEHGLASHVSYTEAGKPKAGGALTKNNKWINELLTWQKEDNEHFTEKVKVDFFKDRIFVHTPKGEVVELPEGSTVIDFAFAIHTDIGEHASGARINNQYKALSTKLKGGDTVFVETKKSSRPTEKWLDYAKSPSTRQKIKSYLKIKH
jgi:GTP pyrophosphokinase